MKTAQVLVAVMVVVIRLAVLGNWGMDQAWDRQLGAAESAVGLT